MIGNVGNLMGPVYVMPFTAVGVVVYHILADSGVEVCGLCDNKPFKEYDIRCISPKSAVEENPNATFVIASAIHGFALLTQLKSLRAKRVVFAEQFIMPKHIAYAENLQECKTRRIIKQAARIDFAILVPRKGLKTIKKISLGSDIIVEKIGSQGICKQQYTNSQEKEAELIDSLTGCYVQSIIISKKIDEPLFELLRCIISHTNVGKIYLNSYWSDTISVRNVERLSEMGCQVVSSNYDPISGGMSGIPIQLNKFKLLGAQDKYIFILNPKTATTSLSNVFQCHEPHVTAKAIYRNNVKTYPMVFSFGFVRNPWDRFLSAFFYSHFERSFEDFVHYLAQSDHFMELSSQKDVFSPQYAWFFNNKGRIIVNFIGRFEHLERDATAILQRIGITYGKQLPKVNTSNHKPYQEYYNSETIEIVRKLYAKDIELFGYDFDYNPPDPIITNFV